MQLEVLRGLGKLPRRSGAVAASGRSGRREQAASVYAGEHDAERAGREADATGDLATREALAPQRHDLALAVAGAGPIARHMTKADPAVSRQAGEQDRDIAFGKPDLPGDRGRVEAGGVKRADPVDPGVSVSGAAATAHAGGALIAERPPTTLTRNAAGELRLTRALAHPLRPGGIQPPRDRRGGNAELGGDLPQKRALGAARAGPSDQIITRGQRKASL